MDEQDVDCGGREAWGPMPRSPVVLGPHAPEVLAGPGMPCLGLARNPWFLLAR